MSWSPYGLRRLGRGGKRVPSLIVAATQQEGRDGDHDNHCDYGSNRYRNGFHAVPHNMTWNGLGGGSISLETLSREVQPEGK